MNEKNLVQRALKEQNQSNELQELKEVLSRSQLRKEGLKKALIWGRR